MHPHNLRQVASVLAEALQRPAHERERFVRAQCGDDDELASEVLALVAHFQRADSDGFLAAPATAEADRLLGSRLLGAGESSLVAAAAGARADEIVRRIVDAQLAAADDVAQWCGERPDDPSLQSGADLLTSLVTRGKLTTYQAEVLARNSGEPLVLGNYELLDPIAEGGMGRVFRARHRLMNRVVAVKLMAGSAIDSPAAARRFQREVETAARLNHANIVQAYDADAADGTHLLVMECVDGSDLGRMVRRMGPLPVVQAVDYVLQAARGLAFAHQHRVVHRDVKPSNMLVDRENTLKILDMGLARFDRPVDLDSSITHDELTRDNQFFGTLDYMAPEQAVSAKTADHRADIYSLGCTLYYLLTARPPFPAGTPAAKIVAHREEPIPRLADLRGDVPAALDDLLARMLAKQPEDRVQTASEVIDRLEAVVPLLSDEPVEDTWAHLPDPLPVTEGPGEASHTTATYESSASGSQTVQPLTEPIVTRPAATAPRERSWWPQLVAVLLILAGGSAVYNLVLRLTTSEGTLVVTFAEDVSLADVVVQVDDEAVQVETTDDGKAITIGVDPGRRRLRIETKDGTRFYAEDEIEVSRGGTKLLTARLMPTGRGDIADAAAGVDSTKDGDAGPPGLSREREIVELATSQGNSAWIVLASDESQGLEIKDPRQLPDEPFHVTAANLNGHQGVTDEVLARFRGLSRLKDLRLGNTRVGDAGMQHVATLKRLLIVDLYETAVTGEGLKHLSQLPELDDLNLTGLSLVDEDLQYIPPNTKVLALAGTPVTRLSGLAHVKSLEWINLNDMRIDPIEMETLLEHDTLRSIRSIYLQGTQLSEETLALLLTRLSLEELFLSKTQTSDEGLRQIARQQGLQRLQLDGCPNITDDCIADVARLPELVHLGVHDTNLTDAAVEQLTRMPRLETLDIRRTRITEDGFEKLKQGLPNCHIEWSAGPPEFMHVAPPVE